MTDFTRNVFDQIDDNQIQAIAQRLGISNQQAEAAVQQALPMLVGGLAHNAQSESGTGELMGALQRDHTGIDLGGLLGGLLGGGGGFNASTGGMGGAILGHIFGDRQERASNNLGRSSGIGGQNAGQLMAMLAPIVMAALGKMVQSRGMGKRDLGQTLGQEKQQIEKSGGGGLLNSVLDRDGDGDVDASDLIQAGMSAISMFGRRG